MPRFDWPRATVCVIVFFRGLGLVNARAISLSLSLSRRGTRVFRKHAENASKMAGGYFFLFVKIVEKRVRLRLKCRTVNDPFVEFTRVSRVQLKR